MIPKKIHYCWLGGGKKPPLAEKCIKSWKKYCPDYEIIEWNETNLDMESFPLYTRQAYERKVWGFVPDYIRLWIVYNYGGIYLDTDVELIKSPDALLGKPAYFGFEDGGCVALGLMFGAQAGNPILEEMMEDYENRSFIKEDGSIDTTAAPDLNTIVFERHGIIKNNTYQEIPGIAVIYPTEYFCPLGYYTGVLKKTKNTYSIHHFMASWQTDEQKKIHDKRVKSRNRQGQKNDFNMVKKDKGFFYATVWALVQRFKR